MAEITMTLQEYNAFHQARLNAEADAARLRQEVAEAKLADPEVASLVVGLRAAREVMPFAMMFVPRNKWPLGALRTFADIYERMPGADANDQAVAIDFRDFVKEVADDLAQRAIASGSNS